jgi:tetratricopeptide (TPR) repeat protein
MALVAGDLVDAERNLVLGLEVAERDGSLGVASTYQAQCARVLVDLGRYDDAQEAVRRAREFGASDDIATGILWRQALARVFAHRGEHETAKELALEAVARAEQTDMLWTRGDAQFDLAEVLELGGDADGAAAALERALAEYQQKGVIPAAERTRARLAALRAPA